MKKTQTVNIKDFMKGKTDPPIKRKPIKAYSLYINPAAFFDLTFIMIGAAVFAVAILEKKLAENGLISIAATLSSILRIALPVVALASLIYLVNQISFLL